MEDGSLSPSKRKASPRRGSEPVAAISPDKRSRGSANTEYISALLSSPQQSPGQRSRFFSPKLTDLDLGEGDDRLVLDGSHSQYYISDERSNPPGRAPLVSSLDFSELSPQHYSLDMPTSKDWCLSGTFEFASDLGMMSPARAKMINGVDKGGSFYPIEVFSPFNSKINNNSMVTAATATTAGDSSSQNSFFSEKNQKESGNKKKSGNSNQKIADSVPEVGFNARGLPLPPPPTTSTPPFDFKNSSASEANWVCLDNVYAALADRKRRPEGAPKRALDLPEADSRAVSQAVAEPTENRGENVRENIQAVGSELDSFAPNSSGNPPPGQVEKIIFADHSLHSAANDMSKGTPTRVVEAVQLQSSANGNATRSFCNCKKSRCLKLYCDCFRLEKYCQSCNCIDCANLPKFESDRLAAIQSILERNPDAFRPRIAVIQNANKLLAQSIDQNGAEAGGFGDKAQVSMKPQPTLLTGHLSGCHCKKSACLKKYCECFCANVPCTDRCRCHDCKNGNPNSISSANFEVNSMSTFVRQNGGSIAESMINPGNGAGMNGEVTPARMHVPEMSNFMSAHTGLTHPLSKLQSTNSSFESISGGVDKNSQWAADSSKGKLTPRKLDLDNEGNIINSSSSSTSGLETIRPVPDFSEQYNSSTQYQTQNKSQDAPLSPVSTISSILERLVFLFFVFFCFFFEILYLDPYFLALNPFCH